MQIFVETERLILREMLEEDLVGMYELDSDPEVHRYLGNRPLKKKEEALEIIRSVRQQYIDRGIGRWSVIEKESNDFIGWAGLKLEKKEINNYADYYDLGYRLRRKFWGKGIGRECAFETLKYGFGNMDLKEIFAAAHIQNQASNKILRGLGLKYLETFKYDRSFHNWYRITKDEWEVNFKNIKNK
jgi:ribosomal-protein-alanine N-acetyltransferase